ncbi:hypothetical protein ACLOJK_034547 [Asimina triloba]
MEKKKEKMDTIVLYPSPGIGHFISMVELGKRFLTLQDADFSITVLLTQTPSTTTPPISSYITRVASSHPSISFLPLLPLSLPLHDATTQDTCGFQPARLNKPLVHHALSSLSRTSSIRAFILDFFCTQSLAIAQRLLIPSYFFLPFGASPLTTLLYFPTLHRLHHDRSFKDLGCQLNVPGFPPFSPTDLPLPIIDRNHAAYEDFLDVALSIPKADGIIINSFEALEPRAVEAIRDGSCVTDGPTPPAYCVGPLLAAEREDKETVRSSGCLEWLDLQPSRSVVFLCFGSMGRFSAAQLKEIAAGLEQSGQRFLWVVRNPPAEKENRKGFWDSEPDLDALLPEGFLDRTEGRGMVVKGWAPQVLVLGRESVGGFVTHCGWNSVLESLQAGVPMVAWPLYAEQRLNRVFLVEEAKLALPLKADKHGFVTASEVGKRVRELMESEAGKAVAERTMGLKEKAAAALSLGGSSHAALTELVKLWKPDVSSSFD